MKSSIILLILISGIILSCEKENEVMMIGEWQLTKRGSSVSSAGDIKLSIFEDGTFLKTDLVSTGQADAEIQTKEGSWSIFNDSIHFTITIDKTITTQSVGGLDSFYTVPCTENSTLKSIDKNTLVLDYDESSLCFWYFFYDGPIEDEYTRVK
ncbi:MAG: hypothetical protein R2780_15540 [Crocinitomicaceae bacterium]|nr:hypothetical protein [Crocinitomicaceae bacterium]